MKWVFVSLLGISLLGNVAWAHGNNEGSWCERHPRACEERRGYRDHDKHRIGKWCKRHPRACQEYSNPPRPIVIVPPPAPVIVVPAPGGNRDSWCRRHPNRCEERRHRH